MELKVSSALAADEQADAEVSKKDDHRNLFNYKYTPVAKKRVKTETSRATKFSHVSEYLLNCIQISELALARGFKRAAHRCHFYRRSLTDSTWLEEQFLDSLSETTNTFLLTHRLEHDLISKRENTTSAPDWRMPKELSTEVLDDALVQLQQGLLFKFDDIVRSGAAESQAEFVLASASRAAFFAINHEIIENAMSHGVSSSINPHAAKANQQDFGKLFYLQTTTESFTEAGASNTDVFPEAFGAYHKSRSGRKKRGKQAYRIITYFDTGLGIQRHFERFGNSEERQTIAQIASLNLSARPIIGSGKGIYKMKQFASGLGAFLTIATADSTYTFDGNTDKESETLTGQISRGTVVSIFLPEK